MPVAGSMLVKPRKSTTGHIMMSRRAHTRTRLASLLTLSQLQYPILICVVTQALAWKPLGISLCRFEASQAVIPAITNIVKNPAGISNGQDLPSCQVIALKLSRPASKHAPGYALLALGLIAWGTPKSQANPYLGMPWGHFWQVIVAFRNPVIT